MLIGGAEGLGGAVGLLDIQETQAGDCMNLHVRHLTLLQRTGRIVLIPRQDQIADLEVLEVLAVRWPKGSRLVAAKVPAANQGVFNPCYCPVSRFKPSWRWLCRRPR